MGLIIGSSYRVYEVLAAGYIVSRYDFWHLNLSLSTDNHKIDTNTSLECLISLKNSCKLTPPV